MSAVEVVLVTGMSGAGRSTAARALEDQGWFVVDNLLPALIPETVRALGGEGVHRVAVVVDVRGGKFFDDTERALARLRESGLDVRICFLEASDECLVRRFESNRRPHPLQQGERLVEKPILSPLLVVGLRTAKFEICIGISFVTIPPLRPFIGFGFSCFLTMLTPSTTAVEFASTRTTVPCFPLSLPELTITLSPFLILFITILTEPQEPKTRFS